MGILCDKAAVLGAAIKEKPCSSLGVSCKTHPKYQTHINTETRREEAALQLHWTLPALLSCPAQAHCVPSVLLATSGEAIVQSTA